MISTPRSLIHVLRSTKKKGVAIALHLQRNRWVPNFLRVRLLSFAGISFGKRVRVAPGALFLNTNLRIGDDVEIGENTKFLGIGSIMIESGTSVPAFSTHSTTSTVGPNDMQFDQPLTLGGPR